jgi:hypothetical protein
MWTAIALLAVATVLPAAIGDPRLAGRWQLDPALSDDFAARFGAALAERQQREQRRRPRSMSPLEVASMPDMPPPEAPERQRERLLETLKPATELGIRLAGQSLEMRGDAEPVRSYALGQSITRMDSSGTATVTASWSGAALVIRSKYTHREQRLQQYTIDRSGDTLYVTLQLNDPQLGKLQLQSTYHRRAD